MNEKTFITHRRDDLVYPINDLLEHLRKPLETGGAIVFLNGQLGTGKTAFVQEFAYQLDIEGRVQSPTFTLMKKYSVDTELIPELYTLVHIDAYRLEPHHKETLKVEDFLTEVGTLVFVEWPTAIDLDPDLAIAHIDFDFVTDNLSDESIDESTADDINDMRRIKMRYK